MAAVAIRRRWTSAVLAVINVIIIALAVAFLLRPAPAATPMPQVAGLPPGAAKCDPVYRDLPGPFNAGARGTPMTSCFFVEQVRRAYVMSPMSQLRVVSPTTRKPYDLQCTPAENEDYVTCTGGQDAIIYLYHT